MLLENRVEALAKLISKECHHTSDTALTCSQDNYNSKVLSLSLSLCVRFFCSFNPILRVHFLYLGLIRAAPTKVYIKMVKSALTPKGRSRVVRKDHSQSSPPRVLSMSAPVHTSLREIPLERDTESDGEQAEISLSDSKYLVKCNLNKNIILIFVVNLHRSDSWLRIG